MTNDAKLPSGFRLHQILFGGLGGHASVALSLIGSTPQLQHSVTFFGTDPPRSEHVELCRARHVAWTGVTKRPGLDPQSLRSVLADLRARRPEVVLVHSTTTMPAALAHRLSTGVPFVVVDHTPNAAKERREWVALATSLAVSDSVVFLTPVFRAEVRARFGRAVDLARTTVIPNGIDTERFRPAPRAIGDSSRVVVSMLSRFTPQRDHATIVSAVESLLARDANLRARLRVVLAGDGETLGSIRALVTSRGLDDVITTPGVLDETNVVKLLHASDIYVHSSLAETMSTSVMQAMSTGLPVVATRITGMDLLIDDGRSGVLFTSGRAPELASVVAGLIADPQRRTSLGAEARRDAIERLSAARMAADYQHHLREAVSRRSMIVSRSAENGGARV
ncbi:glycosyltransferase family 4 protein [Sandaracinus amylolyticus]|uniref:glycosyltransferase family 4 protein n=1 Tax=Sandaracinus amylolyticus TaxID=927083 RepID=UPI001F3E8D17|nr:glycosyltransferase family 4 protein [Sandaracinus amylolyticus]UJR80410.1 Glycosyl transferase, group 1 [Sandaracinus amylolyticus]